MTWPGFHLEDQVFPKLCGAMGGIELIFAEGHATKIQAVNAARSSAELLDNLVASMPG
ncbi:hypothetical protein [Mycobacterium lepromatosis]|uniref:hypothetical protein n=1 Tax=Mycobacterium lepromatosis TaxID=480418 RepID=UPI0012E09737|nr:hypothetical protein [Mycobacterium lepromatosis]